MKHLPMKRILVIIVALLNNQLTKDCFKITFVESTFAYHTHVNHTFVLEQYISVCGHEFLCNSSIVPLQLKSNNSYESHIKCPPCYCNISCLANRNCCPDLYLTLPPMTCETTDIEEFKRQHPEKFRIVTSCPDGTMQEQIDACGAKNLSIIDRMFLTPVTSKGNFPLAFKNRHCAICNGFNAESNWIFNISCSKPTDFNYFSSYEEILKRASERDCHLSFYPINDEYANNCENNKIVDEMTYYNTCRWTDYWNDSDNDDIQKMCESEYDLEIRLENSGIIFKNVFCYICNSPYYDDNVIETCNASDVWKPYDEKLINACQYYPSIAVAYPFKNIFCQLCNTNMENSLSFTDAEVTITQSHLPYQYNITVEHFSFDYFYQVYLGISSLSEYEYYEDFGDIFEEFEIAHDTNPNSLFEKIHAFSPKKICHNSLKDGFSTYSSEELHVQVMKLICYDYRLVYPIWCSSKLVRTYHSYLHHLYDEERVVPLVIGCYRDNLPELASHAVPYCGPDQGDSIFTYLPVMKVKGDMNQFLFISVFCALCNIGGDEVSNLMSTDPTHYVQDTLYNFLRFLNVFDIAVSCSSHINFHNHVFLHSVIQTAYSMGCEVRYEPPPESDASCEEEDYDIGYCNSTGLWTESDEDVKYYITNACTYMDLSWPLPVQRFNNITYRNEYCILCNPLYSETNAIDSCNITGALESFCKDGPEIQALYPYKNIFCKLCNLGIDIITTETIPSFVTTPPPPPPTTPDPTDNLPSLRSLFSIQQYDKQSQQHDLTCSAEQVYDSIQGQCRNKTCYPGKFFNGSNCMSLLTITNNLRYVITLRSVGVMTGVLSIQEMKSFYNLTLKDRLMDIFKTSNLVIETMFSLYNLSCDFETNSTDSNLFIDILTYVKVFVLGDVQRQQVETDIVSFMSTNLNFTFDGGMIDLQNSFNRHASHIQSLLHEYDQVEVCYIHKLSDPITNVSIDDFRTVHVSDLLICVQTAFKKYEYRLDWDGLTLYLVNIGLKFYYEEFHILSDGMATVCLDRVLSAMNHASVIQNSFLRVLTTICVTVSVLGLFLTLLTYVLFPPLRTLPGKNNIVLIVTLLMAQILLLIQPNVTDNDTLCIVIGSLSHYIWLCYFASLVACSVHMFRVFTGLHMHYGNNANKTVVKYIAFIFVLPAVIVVSVITFTIATTDGQDWGYSTHNCFIKEKNVYISTFITPLVAACTCNLICFIITANKIRAVPKIQKNKPDQMHFFVYLKLFVLTGLTWAFQIIDAFLLESVLSYISTFLNGCQGLLIFLTYVCNRRVLNLYKQLLFGRDSDNEFQSSDTKDSGASERTTKTSM